MVLECKWADLWGWRRRLPCGPLYSCSQHKSSLLQGSSTKQISFLHSATYISIFWHMPGTVSVSLIPGDINPVLPPSHSPHSHYPIFHSLRVHFSRLLILGKHSDSLALASSPLNCPSSWVDFLVENGTSGGVAEYRSCHLAAGVPRPGPRSREGQNGVGNPGVGAGHKYSVPLAKVRGPQPSWPGWGHERWRAWG